MWQLPCLVSRRRRRRHIQWAVACYSGHGYGQAEAERRLGQGPKLGMVGSRYSGRSVYVSTSDDVIRRRCPIDDYENKRAAALSAQSGRGHVQRPTLTSITHCGTTVHTAVKLTQPTADGLVQCTKQRRHLTLGRCVQRRSHRRRHPPDSKQLTGAAE